MGWAAQGLQIWGRWGVEPSREILTKMWTLWYSQKAKFRQVLVETSTPGQWLKWFCEAWGSPDEARLEQTPYTFQPQLIWHYLGIK